MTQLREEQVTCPSCHKSHNVTLYDTINADLNPDFRVELLDGKINAFKCSQCGHEALIDIPLLYHDMKRKFGIWYYPVQLLEQEDFCDDFSIDGKLKFDNPLQNLPGFKKAENYLSESHIVFNMQEMIFYIIFRERLFDHYSD